MLYLLLAILFSTGIVISFKYFARLNIHNLQAITVNYLVASSMGFLIHPEAFSFAELPSRDWFVISCIVGAVFIMVFFVFALSAQKVGVAVTAVSSKMSVVIPVSIGIMAYGESLNSVKIAGILASLLAFYLTFKKKENQKVDKRFVLLPVLLFLGNGTNDTFTKHATMFYVGNEYLLFLANVFLVSLVVGVTMLLITASSGSLKFTGRSLLAGVWLGLLNFGSSYFFLLSLGIFESSVFFPIFNVSIVSGAALAGLLLFKEKLSAVNWTGIFLAICAILLITLGA
jgi:multidrug transporter EmrE-like cation transporter